MPRVDITIRPEDPIEKLLPTPPNVLASYTRLISSDNGDDEDSARVERMFTLSRALEAQFELPDYLLASPIQLSLATSQGMPVLMRSDLQPQVGDGDDAPMTLEWKLGDGEIQALRTALTPLEPGSTRVLARSGRFVVIGAPPPDFRDYMFLVSPLAARQLPEEVLTDVFGVDEFRTVARPLGVEELPKLSRLQLSQIFPVALTLQGQFEFTVPIDGKEAGWVWVLSGSMVFAGIQEEPDLTPDSKPATILLPVPAGPSNGGAPAGETPANGTSPVIDRPIDATEVELINNPNLFSDDPGSFCAPFRNPNRIIGERAFHTILRVTQPEIGGDPSVPPAGTLPPFPFSPDLVTSAELMALRERDTPAPVRRAAVKTGLTNFIVALRESAGDSPLVSTRAALAQRRHYVLMNSRGRTTLNRNVALEWEGDSTIYQATSLGFGHILESRIRWRSNGYSLGNVAHTLTLAPRQTRRILTVESRILDRVRREEVTQATDVVSQETRRDYNYLDAVRANLSEWARGGSEASTTGAAGGFGFALGPVVIGGGASHGQSNSSSWQQGGRSAAAREEQALRDAIRQYGESLRKLESRVVIEESQQEFVQAVSEVVRNPNYCHSLTVIYHEILRHLRVDTEVVGARECVFVPLAIRPFTLERAIRWRDILERGLLKPELRWVMRYLEDVNEDFASGTIPEGQRAQQPIRFLTGSIHLQLAIACPQNKDDGTFNEPAWQPLVAHLNMPVRQAFARLQEVTEAERDARFQRDNAPAIAASWVNSLRLSAANSPLAGVDFTLASRYQFNRTLRVDFTYTPSGVLTRQDLQNITVSVPAEAKLSPSSVANVQRVEIRYHTDTFDRREASPIHADDLISVETGEPEPQGASAFIRLSDWERQDLRTIIRGAATDLITHLNEYVEGYSKLLWWELDRDKLHMMLDSVYALGPEDGRSVASVVERDPIAIMGNSLVYRVAGGAFLGVDGHKSPAALNHYYRDTAAKSEPIRVSLPTSGLYAQAVMDECEACEEHFGSTEWVLSDKEPELAELGLEAIASRRATLPEATPTPFPASIINLQNAPNVPPPSGLADVLNAVQNAAAFRDMAGLAGTQANARAAMEAAANLANQFGQRALELRKAELAAKQLAVIDRAEQKGAIDQAEKKQQTKKVLDQMTSAAPATPMLTQEPAIEQALRQGGSFKASRSDGGATQAVEFQPVQWGMPSLGSFCESIRRQRAYWQVVKANVAALARTEAVWKWNNGTKRTDTDPDMLPVVAGYWREGVYPDIGVPDYIRIPDTDWSAAFIAWVVNRAGGSRCFSKVNDEATIRPDYRPAAHFRYFVPARENSRLQSLVNPFWAYRVTLEAPQVGDIVIRSRAGSDTTFDTPWVDINNTSFPKTHGDIVVEMRANEIVVVGGNVSVEGGDPDVGLTVRERTIALDASGRIPITGGHFAIVRINTDQYNVPWCDQIPSVPA